MDPVFPAPQGRIGRGFSPWHQAIDVPAPAGSPIVAMYPGTVQAVGEDALTPYNLDFSESGGGIMVVLRHRIRTPFRTLTAESQYAHASAIAPGIRPGAVVRAGQTIALVGSTGQSTGPHVHVGWRIGGVWRPFTEPAPGPVDAEGVTMPTPPAGYGSGPVQNPPRLPWGDPVDAYPLDAGKTCAPGYVLGTVNPRLHGAIPGLWWNRPTYSDGTVLACVRQGLQPGDNAAVTDASAGLGELAEAIGDTARNFGLFLLFAVLLILGAWALVRGRG